MYNSGLQWNLWSYPALFLRGDLFCFIVDQRTFGGNTQREIFKLVNQPSVQRLAAEGEGSKLPQLYSTNEHFYSKEKRQGCEYLVASL